MASYQKFLLTSSQPDLGHMDNITCKGVWATTCFCFITSIIEESKGEGSMYRQSTRSAMSDRPKLQEVFDKCSPKFLLGKKIFQTKHRISCVSPSTWVTVIALNPEQEFPHHQLDWKVGETNRSILESVLSFRPRVTSRDSGSYRGIVKRALVPWDSIQTENVSQGLGTFEGARLRQNWPP